MCKKIFIYIKKPLVILIILGFFLPLFPQRASALAGVGDSVIVVGDVSPTGINNFINHQMQHLKDFVLDKLATLVAKQILHQMTMSVVNWINSGFKGSPAFLTNPEGFFLDVADQVTGAFLATNGPLSALCSPFNIDIRLSLALGQSQLTDQRYECTLGKIIQAQKNGPSITVNGQTVRSSNGTMSGFLAGDFNQGGWPAFIALTTVPQNNPYGAMIQAQSDLYAKIGQKQNTIHADLQMGSGFMSWQSCKDIATAVTEDEIAQGDEMAANDPGITAKGNKDGSITYQSCETQTPGSVIAGTLQTNLNVPVVELELANDINAVINALVTQMISTMLNTGLRSLSGGSSTGGASYTQQVINDANSTKASQGNLSYMQEAITPAIDGVSSYKYTYEQAVSAITDTKNRYLAAKACFTSKQNNQGAIFNNESTSINIINIDNTISSTIDPLLSDLQSRLDSAKADLKKLEDISYSLAGTGSAEQTQAQVQKYTDFVQNGGTYVQPKIDAANAALANAQAQAQRLNADAVRIQNECYAR